MNKFMNKVFSLTTVLALLLMAAPIQLAQAAGEPLPPSDLLAQASYAGDLALSAHSNVAPAATSYARPDGQVTSLVATFTNGAVELTWTENATNETRFEIERYEVGAGGTEFIVVGTVGADVTSFIDTTALLGTSYDYRVVPWRFDIFGGAPIVVNVQTGAGIDAPTRGRAPA